MFACVFENDMTSVGIVGGGISGLSAAWQLSRLGIPFTVYESSNRLGGMIGSFRRDGFLVEHGPNTILETSPRIPELVSALGIESRRVFPNAEAKLRYIVKGGKLHALPQSFAQFVRTPLLSSLGKLRLALEPVIPKSHKDTDQSLADFVERRLGREVLDYFVNPFVGGVYAGSPSRLSVAHAFPKLHRLEQKYGSLIAGTLLGARERARSADKSKLKARMFTFDDGLQVLIDALRESIKGPVRLGRTLTAIEQAGNGWRLHFQQGASSEHTAVLLCAPAHQLARIPAGAELGLNSLASIPYPPIARVTLGFKRGQVKHPLNGFGALAPEKEGLHSLGFFFSSSLFPCRAPEGHVSITAFLGGSRNPEICASGPDAVLQAALADARDLLGIQGTPVFQDVAIIPRSIPQYEVGFGSVRQAMNEFEQCRPGLFLAGNYRDGISAGDSILSGLNAIQKLTEYLRNVETGNSACQHRVA
jgi:protoporphyrinogen/coproporphyrinogen III oxidase